MPLNLNPLLATSKQSYSHSQVKCGNIINPEGGKIGSIKENETNVYMDVQMYACACVCQPRRACGGDKKEYSYKNVQ